MSERSRLPSVVVTYHPDEGFGRRLAAIARESCNIIVVDNSGESADRSRLQAACAAADAELILNAQNVGLGSALNAGFAILYQRGFSAAIAFDQDSTAQAGFSDALNAAADHMPEAAVIGANWSDEARPDTTARHLRKHPHLPILFTRVAPTEDQVGLTCVITSGSYFRLPIWAQLGGFDEGLFLDLVDTEYCLRAKRAGHKIAVSSRAILRHRRGTKQPALLFGRTWWPAHMPPVRLRYLFRNRVRIALRHGPREPHWITFELSYTLKILAEILFLEKAKLEKLAAAARGTWDGFLDIEGPIPG